MNQPCSKDDRETPYVDLYYTNHVKKLSSKWGRHRVKVVLDLIGWCENDVMLDLGCGIGTFTITFSRKNLYVVGVDLSLVYYSCFSQAKARVKARREERSEV